MSKQMDGNDYATSADEQMNYTYESGQLEGLDPNTFVLFQAMNAVIQSNLALAYEQRTANLIAREQLSATYFPNHPSDRREQMLEIYERLGEDHE